MIAADILVIAMPISSSAAVGLARSVSLGSGPRWGYHGGQSRPFLPGPSTADGYLRDYWPVGTGSVDALITEGRDAFEQGDAEGSRRAFEAALAESESGELLEGLARALYLEVDYPGSMNAHQRAFAAYKGEGDALSCARVARLLSWQHINVYGDFRGGRRLAGQGGGASRADRRRRS